jgi:taurine--2-oxoglutarate transaminase
MSDGQFTEAATSASIPHWYDGGDVPNIVRGEGAHVYDETGTEYLDFISMLYCVNAGHGNRTIVDRMTEQLEHVQYVSPSKHNDVRSELADRIVSVAPDALSDVFFSISGSEANEAAAQFAREFQDAPKVLTRWQSYHGGTYGSAALTGDPSTRTTVERYAATTGAGKFLPPLPKAFEADSPEELAEAAANHLEFVIRNEDPDSVAAVLTEPIGGTSGAYPAPPGYFERVREICDEYDVLLISDEVITGFGRCGEWFGIQTEGVQPDMMTFAKAVTSAYVPLAGVATTPAIADHFRENGIEVGQTFGGHPVGCAAGLGAMDAYEDGLLENVRELSPHLEERLRELESHDAVDAVRGRGFHWAVTFADPATGEPFVHPWVDDESDNPVAEVREIASDAGLLVGGGRPDVQIVCSPPFTVDADDVDRAVDVLDDAIGQVFG